MSPSSSPWAYESRELARKRAAVRFTRRADETLDTGPVLPWTPPPVLDDDRTPPIGPDAAAGFRERADQALQIWQRAMARGSAAPTPAAPSLSYQRPGLTAEQPGAPIRATSPLAAENEAEREWTKALASDIGTQAEAEILREQREIGDPALGTFLSGAEQVIQASPLARRFITNPQEPPRPPTSPDDLWNRYRGELGERWRQAPEPFPGVKGFAEAVGDPLNLIGPGEIKAVGRVGAAGARAVGRGVRAVGEEAALRALEVAPAFAEKGAGRTAAVNTTTEVKETLGSIAKGMGQSIREADLLAAEKKMASLRARNPQMTDASAAATPLGKQIERYKADLELYRAGQVPTAVDTTIAEAPSPAAVEPVEAAPAAAGTPPPTRTALGTATEPPTSPLPERAGNILLTKYKDTPIEQAILDTYKSNPEQMEKARRGVIPDAEVRQKADEVASMIGAKAGQWKPGQVWNAESILAARTALEARQREVLVLQKAVKGGDNSDLTLARLETAVQRAFDMQEAVHGVTAEAGRALRQFRQEIPGSPDIEAIQRILSRAGGRKRVEEMAQELGQLDTDNPIAVANFIRSVENPSFWDKVVAVRYFSMLSSDVTHSINALTNAVNVLMAPVERGAAAAIEVPLAAAQRRPRERFFGEVPAEVVGAWRGIRDGARKGLFVLQHGYDDSDLQRLEFQHKEAFQYTPGTGAAAILNRPKRVAIAAIQGPTRAMAASDAFFRHINFTAGVNTEAYRLASKEGLKGQAHIQRVADLLQTPTPELLERAMTWSKYRVFHQEPGKVTGELLHLRGGEVASIPVGKLIVPFVQTPVNILKYGLERSPLGIANPAIYKALKGGDAAASDMLSRWLIGSTVAASLATYAWQGNITGAAPKKEGERDAFYRQGKQPFSFKIGDRWFDYTRLEPFNQPFAQIAGIVDAVKEGEKPPLEAMAQAGFTIGKNLVNKTYMVGISDMLNALEDPARYGGKYTERFATSFVPAIVRRAERVTEPTTSAPEGIPEALKASIPGLSQDVPVRLDAMGQEVKSETPWYSPINTTVVKNDPLENELARLKVAPGKVGDTLSGKKLSREEQQRYQREAGQASKAGLTALVNSAYYGGLDDPGKEKALTTLGNHLRDMAAENTRKGGSTPTADLVQQGQQYAQSWAEFNALAKYRAMPADQAAQADIVLTKVRALAKEKGIGQEQALAQYRRTDPAGAQVAQKALNLGPNPQRAVYLRKHPELTRLLEPVD